MNTPFRRLTALLALSLLALPAARAQHPQATVVDKPWPHVGFLEVFDGTAIPSLGHIRGEGGDCIIDMTNAGDGSGRLFIVTRQGLVYILKDGKLLPNPFLDISALTTMDGERGLLSMTFPPNYKTKGHFYVYYTSLAHDVTIARYKTDPRDPNHALPDSGEILLQIAHRKYSNHNGGQLHFGPDGMLYFGVGDGGSQNDPDNNGQNLGILLAKMIRIDVEGKPDADKPYHVPADNPFVKTPGALPEIWAFGVRNPWRWSFDSATGDMYIGNVGQDLWEQIYWAPAGDRGGENYGWSIIEGTHNSRGTKPDQKRGATNDITFPVAEFGHNVAPVFKSITGGYVYRGKEFPAWDGVYFFSDWLNSQIWAMRRSSDGINWETHEVDDSKSPIKQATSLGLDEQGNIYVTSFDDGKIYKLIELPPVKQP